MEQRVEECTAALIRASTVVARPPACPEIRLHLARDMQTLWERLETALNVAGMPPPFWAIPWAGGQALARYLLDNPAIVSGKRVLDVGSGSGLCAIAAALAGAQAVCANELDQSALAAIGLNAALNDVTIMPLSRDLIGTELTDWDVVLAADLWYERQLAQRVTPWLRDQCDDRRAVLIGDKGRAHFPRRGLVKLAVVTVPTSLEIERESITEAGVWRFPTPMAI